jgi:hypothetical protein
MGDGSCCAAIWQAHGWGHLSAPHRRVCGARTAMDDGSGAKGGAEGDRGSGSARDEQGRTDRSLELRLGALLAMDEDGVGRPIGGLDGEGAAHATSDRTVHDDGKDRKHATVTAHGGKCSAPRPGTPAPQGVHSARRGRADRLTSTPIGSTRSARASRVTTILAPRWGPLAVASSAAVEVVVAPSRGRVDSQFCRVGPRTRRERAADWSAGTVERGPTVVHEAHVAAASAATSPMPAGPGPRAGSSISVPAPADGQSDLRSSTGRSLQIRSAVPPAPPPIATVSDGARPRLSAPGDGPRTRRGARHRCSSSRARRG